MVSELCLLHIGQIRPLSSQRRCWGWPCWEQSPACLGQPKFLPKASLKSCRGHLVPKLLHAVFCLLHANLRCCLSDIIASSVLVAKCVGALERRLECPRGNANPLQGSSTTGNITSTTPSILRWKGPPFWDKRIGISGRQRQNLNLCCIQQSHMCIRHVLYTETCDQKSKQNTFGRMTPWNVIREVAATPEWQGKNLQKSVLT